MLWASVGLFCLQGRYMGGADDRQLQTRRYAATNNVIVMRRVSYAECAR